MSEACQGKDVDWAQGYPWAYRVKQYKFISYSSEWLFSAGGSWRYLSHSPFSLWFGSFEQCGPRQLVRTATSVTLPPGWIGRGGGGDGGDGRDGRGAQRGVEGGGGDDRLGRPTPERFHKSRVSKQGSVSGNRENLNEAHHLLVRCRYCCLLPGKRLKRESAPVTQRSTSWSPSTLKPVLHMQLSTSAET